MIIFESRVSSARDERLAQKNNSNKNKLTGKFESPRVQSSIVVILIVIITIIMMRLLKCLAFSCLIRFIANPLACVVVVF